MTDDDVILGVARRAMKRALEAGARGLSEIMREAIVSDAIRTIRRELNLPAPRYLSNEPRCPICGHEWDAWMRCFHPACHDGRLPKPKTKSK